MESNRYNQGRSQGEGGGGAPPPIRGKIITYSGKKQGKSEGKGEKSANKMITFRGETERIRKNNEKEIKNFKNCPKKFENF